jgi:UDP-N-acetylglucosamine:LPS N-acetylglucosamine transferase
LIAEKPEDFVDSVLKLLEDSSLRESMEANAKSFAKEELDNTKLTATLVQFYNSILS